MRTHRAGAGRAPDVPRFRASLAGGKPRAIVQSDVEHGTNVAGALATPTFFVNGRRLVGLQSIDAFRRIIDEEVRKQERRRVTSEQPSLRLRSRFAAEPHSSWPRLAPRTAMSR